MCRRLSLIILLALAVCESPAAESDASIFLQQAYDRLLSVKAFAFGEVGGAWTPPQTRLTSEGERCLRTPAASTNGLPLFKAALTNGTTEARLYALIGIRHLAPQQFDTLAAPTIAANPRVRLRIGDIGMVMSASNIVAQIKKGFYEEYCPAENRR
jgi:hypothetical protein